MNNTLGTYRSQVASERGESDTAKNNPNVDPSHMDEIRDAGTITCSIYSWDSYFELLIYNNML
jgi:hypothetical protein